MLVSVHCISAMGMTINFGSGTAYLEREGLYVKLVRLRGSKLFGFSVTDFPYHFNQCPKNDWDRLMRRADAIHADQSPRWAWVEEGDKKFIVHRLRWDIRYEAPDLWSDWREAIGVPEETPNDSLNAGKYTYTIQMVRLS